MEILFLLGVLILWYFLSKRITNNRHHSSLNIKEGDWQANYKPKFSVDKEQLELHEDDEYIWNLNDSIKHYNNLSINNRLIVLRGILNFINDVDQENQTFEFFKKRMLYWTNKRQQHMREGPSANWVLASTLEAICQMCMMKDDHLVKKFLSSPPIHQFGKK